MQNGRIVPFAVQGKSQSACERQQGNRAKAIVGPLAGSFHQQRQHQATRTDKYVTCRAVQYGENELACFRRGPYLVEWQLYEFPHKI